MGVSGGLVAMGIMSMGNAYSNAESQKAQADFTTGQLRMNEKLAGVQAASVKEEGDLAASAAEKTGAQREAEQRVHQAATGVDVNSGSALNLQSDTAWQTRQNQITIRNNAWRAAWGYNIKGLDLEMQARESEIGADNNYRNTLLTGGMQAIGYGEQAGGSYKKYNG